MDAIVPNELFMIKSNLDINKVKNEEWPRMSSFTLTQRDVKKIVKFCKKHKTKTNKVELDCEPICEKFKSIESDQNMVVKFAGDSLVFQPHHSLQQKGYYLRIVLSNGINILYKFENGELLPFMYSTMTNNILFANPEYQQEYELLDGPENMVENTANQLYEKTEKNSFFKRVKSYGSNFWHKVF